MRTYWLNQFERINTNGNQHKQHIDHWPQQQAAKRVAKSSATGGSEMVDEAFESDTDSSSSDTNTSINDRGTHNSSTPSKPFRRKRMKRQINKKES